MKTLNLIFTARNDYRNNKDVLTARAQAQTLAQEIVTTSDDERREAFRIIHDIITK